MLIGIPASGKTTFCLDRFSSSHLRLCRDVLHTRYREDQLFETALRTKTPVVIDNTNVTRAERHRFITPAREEGFTVKGYIFKSDPVGSRKRNAARDDDERVPDVAIGDKANRLEAPSWSEGFDQLFVVALDGQGGFVSEEQVR